MISAGARLGPYEIESLLGAGGMGEVYRAHDPRLKREVAIKVLPASLASDPDAMARFEREALAVAALSHPNILAIHDFGRDGATAYAVTELLEGETLRKRLESGALPQRKALDCAVQMARGLAAAHAKGIVHRDLKPENVIVTNDGTVKILDFGLARTVVATGSEDTKSPTAAPATSPGTLLGTAGYMSPEQVKGLSADARSDIFSFGCVLYEMLSGRRAFRRETVAETLTAILREDAPELTAPGSAASGIAPALDRLVRHCLEKAPEERFQTARDLVFALETATSAAGAETEADSARYAKRAGPQRKRAGAALLLLGGVLLGGAATLLWNRIASRGRTAESGKAPSFQRLTYRRGTIRSARFLPDGRSVIYGAAWNGAPTKLFMSRADTTGATPLALPDAEILSVSSSVGLAISLGHTFERSWMGSGTLATTPLFGGSPRPLLADVREADFVPSGADLAIVRRVGTKERLELPEGKVLYETFGYVSHVRVSRDGLRIGFLDHPVWGDDRGDVAILDRSGTRTTLSKGWSSLRGLAWSPDGREIWFSGDRGTTNAGYGLHAVDLAGRERSLLNAPGSIILLDVSSDGRALLTREEQIRPILVKRPEDTRPRDLAWLDSTVTNAVSDDGRAMLITSWGEKSGMSYAALLRGTDGSPPVDLGVGETQAFSRDGRWALTIDFGPPTRILVLPTGLGTQKTIVSGGIAAQQANWLPDGARIVFAGAAPGQPSRLYVQEIDATAPPRPVSPDGTAASGAASSLPVSPDGRSVVATGPDGKAAIFPLDGGAPRPIAGLGPRDVVIRWTADGSALLVATTGPLPMRVERLEPGSGRRTLWKEFTVDDLAGVYGGAHYLRVTPDGSTWVWSPVRLLHDLFIAEGLK